jgi:Glycosyltransferase
MSKRKKIAAFVPNVLGFSPGQRVRIELWAKYLKEAGWEVEFFPFEDDRLHEVLYGGSNFIPKIGGLIRCYEKQMEAVLRQLPADVIFIYREAALIGPSLLEKLAARQRIPIVYDLDDPVFLPYKSPANSWASLLKFSRKTHSILRLSERVITINKLIGDYASRYNPSVTIIPNCIDTDKYFPLEEGKKLRNLNSTNLIWIGSQSTMQNLSEIAEPIRRLQQEHSSPLTVIGAGEIDIGIEEIIVRQWSAESELVDLQTGDIGLLPLNDLIWNKWKFFYKAIQYMAIGIPVVARRIGSNSEVIEDGVNGFLVETSEEWYDRLKYLICNPEVRMKMGVSARRTVLDRFSLKTQMPRLLGVFETLAAGNSCCDKVN